MRVSSKKFILRVVCLLAALAFIAAALCGCSPEDDDPGDDGAGREKAEAFVSNVLTVTATDSGTTRSGSSVIIRKGENGEILCLTNYHVVMGSAPVRDAESGEIENAVMPQITVTNADGDAFSASVEGYLPYYDIAVLSVAGYGGSFTEVTEADLSSASDGAAYAIGSASSSITMLSGETDDFTAVSADRLIGSGEKSVPVISATCPTAEGMSGGALLDSEGRLNGILTYADDGGCYAVPAEIAMAVLDAADGGETDIMGGSLGGYIVRLSRTSADTGVYEICVLDTDTYATNLHPCGFVGTLTVSGLSVTQTGSACPLTAGDEDTPADLVTAVGDVEVSGRASLRAVLAELLSYSSDGTGEALTLQTSRGEATIDVLRGK